MHAKSLSLYNPAFKSKPTRDESMQSLERERLRSNQLTEKAFNYGIPWHAVKPLNDFVNQTEENEIMKKETSTL